MHVVHVRAQPQLPTGRSQHSHDLRHTATLDCHRRNLALGLARVMSRLVLVPAQCVAHEREVALLPRLDLLALLDKPAHDRLPHAVPPFLVLKGRAPCLSMDLCSALAVQGRELLHTPTTLGTRCDQRRRAVARRVT